MINFCLVTLVTFAASCSFNSPQALWTRDAKTKFLRRLVLFVQITLCLGVVIMNMSVKSVGEDTLTAFRRKGVASVNGSSHPARWLIEQSESQFRLQQSRQSQTLGQATAEYRRRYRLPPPPAFDKWYEFAASRNVQLVDDFDIVYDLISPFWALKPSTLRGRIREAIGVEDNVLIAVLIRKGEITTLKGGLPWQQEAIRGMLQSFVHFLPDMDLAFNGHDESRIVIPHDELAAMLSHARHGSMSRAYGQSNVRNAFSRTPDDLNDGKRIDRCRTSRFNRYAHQNTWIPARLSCPPGSPARDFRGEEEDDRSTYATRTEIPFLFNQTAFTDICKSPSLKGSHGFFERPNAFSVSHDLIPIFSESKISSFQDIAYPSLWHWYGKLFQNATWDMHTNNTPIYQSRLDPDWSEKENVMWWRGSTTGGYSRDGSWRRQHRQRIVRNLNGLGQTWIMRNDVQAHAWQARSEAKGKFKHLINVKFSRVGQCDKLDGQEQSAFFNIVPEVGMQDTWKYKHLLDMDGNAFSARFYALMRSKSLVYKMAVFREWHDEWIKPWLHYIPLSLDGQEHFEALRYFSEDQEGVQLAERLAHGKSEWAQRALRREDMESWMFRLLLEYARVLQDDREEIGYPG